MPKDYVPQNDTQFQAWLTNFVTVLNKCRSLRHGDKLRSSDAP